MQLVSIILFGTKLFKIEVFFHRFCNNKNYFWYIKGGNLWLFNELYLLTAAFISKPLIIYGGFLKMIFSTLILPFYAGIDN